MLGEFKCDQHIFGHLYKKKMFFDINGTTQFLSTQMHTFLSNSLQNSMWKRHARR